MDAPAIAVNNDHFKVVFLTDSRNWSSDGHSSNVLHSCTSSVRLTVLKLLTYFANGSAGQATHLRWGYKFFNSIDDPPCKRETLKEFTENNVDTFEEQVLAEFEAGLHYIPKRPKTAKSEEKKKKKHNTGLSVQQALADVLQDFQWEGPDIRSPVKATTSAVRTRSQAGLSKANTRGNTQNPSKSNFVFLLMPCPHHQKDVLDFFGVEEKDKQKEDTSKAKPKAGGAESPSTSTDIPTPPPSSSSSDTAQEDDKWTVQEFRDFIVTEESGLQNKLKQNAISLFWIDTDDLHSKCPEVACGDNHGFQIASEAMNQLGGGLIPISTLLTLHKPDLNIYLQSRIPGRPTQGDIEMSTEEEDEEEDNADALVSGERVVKRGQPIARSFFPWSSVIRQCVSSGDVPSDAQDELLTLCVTNKDKNIGAKPMCRLKVQPLFESSNMSNTATSPSQPRKPSTIPTTPPKSHSNSARKALPSTINAHIGDSTLHVTKHTSDKGGNSTDDFEPGELEKLKALNASPSTIKYLKVIRSRMKRKCVLIQGALPTSSLYLGVHFEDQAYTCTGLEIDAKQGQRSSDGRKKKRKRVEDTEEETGILKVSSWFRKLMIDLSQRKLALVVQMQDLTSDIAVTGILEPLTSVTGTLRVIRPSMVQSVDRLVQQFRGGDALRSWKPDNRSGKLSGEAKSKIRKVAVNTVKERGRTSSRIASRREHSPVSVLSGLQGRAQKAMSQFNPHQLEAWYHKAPTHGVPVKFVDHLKEIPEDLSKQSSSHPTLDQLLYDLEVMYDKHKEKEKNEAAITTKAEESKLQVKKTLNLGSRAVSIMKQSLAKANTEKKPATQDKTKEETPEPVNKAYIEIVKSGKNKFKTEEEFTTHLQASYNKFLSGEKRLDSMMWVFKTMRPVLLYAKSKCANQKVTDLTEELVNHAREIASKTLLISNMELKERYPNMDEAGSYERRVREVEMQVLLRLEMEALLPTVIEKPDKDKKKDGDKENEDSEEQNVLDESMSEEIDLPDDLQEVVDEMVTMLQSVPILLDHSRLTTFLEDVVRYYHKKQLGTILKVIYNDLMLTKPEDLMSPNRKPTSTRKEPKSVDEPLSYGSIIMPSVNAGGQRTRGLVRHPSFDVGSKRVIPVVIKKEAAKKPKEKKKKKKEQEDDQAKRVCRNLFSGGEAPLRRSPRKKVNPLPRRQSVAVMESTSAKDPLVTRWTSPRRRTPGKSPSRLVLKTRIVKETPGKKQVPQAMLKKQERARKHTITSADKSDENPTVEESPDKVVKETPHPKRRTPGKSRSKLTRHHSHRSVFYSKDGPKSKSVKSMKELAEAMHLGARIAGKTPEPPKPIRRLLHNRSQSSSAVNVFSNFASPSTLLAVKTEQGDSPSKNTRSQVGIVQDVLSSPKSSKRTPSKSPRKMALRALWKSPEKSCLKSPNKTPQKTDKKVTVQDTPDKTVESEPCITSPVMRSPRRTPKKSPVRTRTPKKEAASVKTPSKQSPRSVTRTSTPVESPSKQNTAVKNDAVASKGIKSRRLPLVTEVNLENKTESTSSAAPCERCIEGDKPSHSSRLASSTSLLISDVSSRCLSTASSLEDVFESPPRKAPSRKSSRTPEIATVFKQKKPQNGASPKTGILKSPTSVRSDSPVFGAVYSPKPKRLTSPPYSGKKPTIVKQSPAVTEGKTTSSPTFGKHTPSPGRKRLLRSPASASKKTKGTKGLSKKGKGQTKPAEGVGSILSWLDIRGLKRDNKAATTETKKDDVNNLLDIVDIEHEKSQEARRRKRERNDDGEEERPVKKRKSTQEEDEDGDDVELLDVDDFILDTDGEINFKNDSLQPVNVTEYAAETSEDVNPEDIKEFCSPSRKLKAKQLPGRNRKQSSQSDDDGMSDSNKRQCSLSDETGTLSEGNPAGASKAKPKQKLPRLPTRRSLAKNMSPGNSPSTSDRSPTPRRISLTKIKPSGNSPSNSGRLPMSPMFSDDTDDSMLLSPDDASLENPISKAISDLQTPTAEGSKKKQYTPVSKKGLADLMNSPLISSAEKLKKVAKGREKRGNSTRRHVSFSSE